MDEALAAEYRRNDERNPIPGHSLSQYGFGCSHDDFAMLICLRDGCNWSTDVGLLNLLQIIHIAIAHNREAHHGQDQTPAQERR